MEFQKKERIKDRMLKTASKIWGIPENELEANYDPLLLLMLEACASELEQIGHDIQASQIRLLDKLADLLLPEMLAGPKPPSAVMQASPLEAHGMVDALTKFLCSQRITQQQKTLSADVYFTPIGKFPLLNTALKNILIGDKLYSVKENGTKETIYEKTTDDSTSVFEIELAIAADKSISSLNNLSLFFDLRSHSEAQSFYKTLQSSKAFVNGQSITIKQGYAIADQFELIPESMLEAGNDYSLKINRQVAGAYQKQFLHIADNRPVNELITTTPDSWQSLIPQDILQKELTEQLIFIKLVLSRPYPRHVLESLMININAFPVVSRKFNTINYRTNEWINIIPLQTEGVFLDLHDVRSGSGSYKFKASPRHQDLQEGEASVRNSGMGKTTSREIKDIVNSLMLAIRDESTYFSDISNDFILNRLREINHILTRLQDQMVSAKELQSQQSYVLLKPKKNGEAITIQYWTTNVANAKRIKAYTLLNTSEQLTVNPKTCYLLTNVVGGKTAVTEAEKKNYLKQQISSAGKIISAEDIKLLAFQVFGEHLKKAEIHKTVKAGSGMNQGFIRTIEIIIYLKEEAQKENPEEMQYLAQDMEYILSQNASPVYPFEVVVA